MLPSKIFQIVEEVEIFEDLDSTASAHSEDTAVAAEPNSLIPQAENRCSVDSKRKTFIASDVIFKIIFFLVINYLCKKSIYSNVVLLFNFRGLWRII